MAADQHSKICTQCRVCKLATEFRPKRLRCRPCDALNTRVAREAAGTDATRAAWRKSYYLNRERCLDRAAKYVASGKHREVLRRFRARNPDYYKELYAERQKADPVRYQVYSSTRRARMRDAEGVHTPDDIQAIRLKQKDRCAVCRARLKGAGEIDHIRALWLGGSNWPNNLQLLCMNCNRRKGHRDEIEFMRGEGRLL